MFNEEGNKGIMKQDHTKLLDALAASPFAARLTQDAESERLARRREALKELRAVKAREAAVAREFEKAARATDDAQKEYQKAEQALNAAGAKIYRADQHAQGIWADHQRAEDAARGAVTRERNPRTFELLFDPLRKAIEETRALRPRGEAKHDDRATWEGTHKLLSRSSTRPAQAARIAYVEACIRLLDAHLLSTDDTDAELTRLAKAILAAAPSHDRLLPVDLDAAGPQRANERAIAEAVSQAQDFAAGGFCQIEIEK